MYCSTLTILIFTWPCLLKQVALIRKCKGGEDPEMKNQLNRHKKSTERPQKAQRYSKADVLGIIKGQFIKNETELLVWAARKGENGLMSQKNFAANNPQKVYWGLIAKTWAMAGAEQVVQRKSKSRIAHLQSFLQNSCDPGCKEKTWPDMALEILGNNDVNIFVFTDMVRELLRIERGKIRNLIITGPSNCGKTFILNPTNTIFDTFTNPSSCKYTLWVVKRRS